MAVEPKTYANTATGYRRLLIWAQIIITFLFLELTLWAPTRQVRNRWAVIAFITMLVFVLFDRPSITRLGLGMPKMSGSGFVLGAGLLASIFLIIVVRGLGGEIPASPAWFPDLRSVWGYLIWALIQEFILQSFFFNRFEELYGGSTAVWMASALFAAVHLPNPVLTTATLIGALFFCKMFHRYRNIYFLGILHAMLGLTVAIVTPDSLLHHMRVGIGYLRY